MKVLTGRLPRRLQAVGWPPARRLLLAALNAVLKRRPRSFECMTPLGFRIAGTTRDLDQRHIYVFGIWEPDATAAIRPYLRDGTTVIDVGANIGYYTLLAALAVGPSGSVHAIEALPTTGRLLRQNVRLNHAANVNVHSVAAGDAPGEVEMFRASDGNLGSSSTIAGELSEGFVPQTRLDDLLVDVHGADVSFVKIDVEGTAANVIRGAQRILGEMLPGSAALVELSPADLRGDHGREESALRTMRELGFDAFTLPNEYSGWRYGDPHVVPPAPLAELPRGWTNLLFVKSGSAPAIDSYVRESSALAGQLSGTSS